MPDKRTEITALLTDAAVEAADPVHGRRVFRRTCQACHRMYGEGGEIGPDITGSNRANLDYLLGNLLEPGEEVQDDYRMTVITTSDGRTYLGNVAMENEHQLTLRVVGQDAVIVNKSAIQSILVPISKGSRSVPHTFASNCTDRKMDAAAVSTSCSSITK